MPPKREGQRRQRAADNEQQENSDDEFDEFYNQLTPEQQRRLQQLALRRGNADLNRQFTNDVNLLDANNGAAAAAAGPVRNGNNNPAPRNDRPLHGNNGNAVHANAAAAAAAAPAPVNQRPAEQRVRLRNQVPANFGPDGHHTARNWVFTAWGQDDWLNRLFNPATGRIEFPTEVDAVRAQQEVSPEAGRNNQYGGLHWQGFVQLGIDCRRNRRQVCELLGLDPRKTWMDILRGTPDQAAKYATKEETRAWFTPEGEVGDYDAEHTIPGQRIEWGVLHGLDAVGGFAAAAKFAATGADWTEICERFPSEAARYSSGLQKLAMTKKKPPKWRKVRVIAFWGPTGTGKSKRVFKEADAMGQTVYKKIAGTEFHEGYENQDVYFLDEFTPKKMSLEALLELTDGHPLQLNVKGSHRWAVFTEFRFASNTDPRTWYEGCNPEQLAAFRRRLPERNMIYMDGPWHMGDTDQEDDEEEEMDEEQEVPIHNPFD